MKIILTLLIAICLNLPMLALAEIVIYNPNTGIYHSVTCAHGKRCKKCIKVDKKEAQKDGARPCKTCGG